MMHFADCFRRSQYNDRRRPGRMKGENKISPYSCSRRKPLSDSTCLRTLLPREMLHCYAQRGLCHVRPSVLLSVTFRRADHTGWNTPKIISRLISLRFGSADPNIGDLVPIFFNTTAVLSQWKPRDAAVNFDTYLNLQRHRAVLPAIARLSVVYTHRQPCRRCWDTDVPRHF